MAYGLHAHLEVCRSLLCRLGQWARIPRELSWLWQRHCLACCSDAQVIDLHGTKTASARFMSSLLTMMAALFVTVSVQRSALKICNALG